MGLKTSGPPCLARSGPGVSQGVKIPKISEINQSDLDNTKHPRFSDSITVYRPDQSWPGKPIQYPSCFPAKNPISLKTEMLLHLALGCPMMPHLWSAGGWGKRGQRRCFHTIIRHADSQRPVDRNSLDHKIDDSCSWDWIPRTIFWHRPRPPCPRYVKGRVTDGLVKTLPQAPGRSWDP